MPIPEATVPKINIISLKAYGGAYIAMSSKHWGRSGICMALRNSRNGDRRGSKHNIQKEIENSKYPIETRKEKIEEYRNKFLIRMLLHPEAILMM